MVHADLICVPVMTAKQAMAAKIDGSRSREVAGPYVDFMVADACGPMPRSSLTAVGSGGVRELLPSAMALVRQTSAGTWDGRSRA